MDKLNGLDYPDGKRVKGHEKGIIQLDPLVIRMVAQARRLVERNRQDGAVDLRAINRSFLVGLLFFLGDILVTRTHTLVSFKLFFLSPHFPFWVFIIGGFGFRQ